MTANKPQFPGWRSLLFVPAHREELLAKAGRLEADAYILDLEDSVPDARKAAARQGFGSAAAAIGQGGAGVLVRINAPPQLAAQDLAAAVDPAVHALVLPKVETAAQVRAIAAAVEQLEQKAGSPPGGTGLIAQIESVAALPALDAIAQASPRLLGMSLGSEDFCASAGMEAIPENLFGPNQQVVFACRRAGIAPLGFPGSIADYRDSGSFRQTVQQARRMGFRGAFCIHPNQVAVLNEAFAPSAEEVAEAEALLQVYQQALARGESAVGHQGMMVDPPVAARARETLQRHRKFSQRRAAKS